jgi:hypothetical protein
MRRHASVESRMTRAEMVLQPLDGMSCKVPRVQARLGTERLHRSVCRPRIDSPLASTLTLPLDSTTGARSLFLVL